MNNGPERRKSKIFRNFKKFKTIYYSVFDRKKIISTVLKFPGYHVYALS